MGQGNALEEALATLSENFDMTIQLMRENNELKHQIDSLVSQITTLKTDAIRRHEGQPSAQETQSGNVPLLFAIQDEKLVAIAGEHAYIISNYEKRKKDEFALKLEISEKHNIKKPLQTFKGMSNQNDFNALNYLLAEAQRYANERHRVIEDTAEAVSKDYKRNNIPLLLGHTLKAVGRPHENRLEFFREDGLKVNMYHSQDCCEVVYLDDVVGDLKDLVGSPLTVAEFYTHWGAPEYGDLQYTFYRLGTAKGFVTLRWIGESNGYYSTEVDVRLEK
jgi:hypothetical protein